MKPRGLNDYIKFNLHYILVIWVLSERNKSSTQTNVNTSAWHVAGVRELSESPDFGLQSSNSMLSVISFFAIFRQQYQLHDTYINV